MYKKIYLVRSDIFVIIILKTDYFPHRVNLSTESLRLPTAALPSRNCHSPQQAETLQVRNTHLFIL